MELPGFFYDPKTKRYFAEQACPSANKLLKSRILGTVKPIVPSNPKLNAVNVIQSREIGNRKNWNMEFPILAMKTEVKFDKGEDVSFHCYENITDILMIKGGDQYRLLGLWKIEDSPEDVLSEIFLEESICLRFENVKAAGITDYCEGFNDFLMVVSNEFSTQKGVVSLLFRLPDIPTKYHEFDFPLFACCSNSFTQRFAIGGEYTAVIEDSMGNSSRRPVKGNVHAVHYDKKGEVLYCGIHTGALTIMDLRDPSCSNMNLFETGINELILLSNQNELICGSFDGDLCKVDLRNKRVVATYLDHKHSTKKTPLSINESRSILCGTGADNVTRIWSLNGGKPIRDIHPPNEGPHRAWLTNDSARPAVYLFQHKFMYTSHM